jgi:dTDP-4-dehydrorhamnose reductase
MKNQSIQASNDRFSQPLFVTDFATAVWQIVKKEKTGVYHLSGLDRVSLSEFACCTAEIFGFDIRLVNPVPNSYFTGLAPRPIDTSFSIHKAERELGFKPLGIRAGLELMKASLTQKNTK